MRLDAMDLQLLSVFNSLTAVRKRLKQHLRRSPSSPLQPESLLSSLFSRFVDGAAGLVIDEVAAHRARLTGVVTAASASLELDLQSILYFFHATKRGYRVSTANPKTSRTSPSFPLAPGNDSSAGQS